MRKVVEYTARDMFNFWVRNERRNRPYLKLKYPGRTKNSELWYKVKAEVSYLESKILSLDVEIQKLEPLDKEVSRFTSTTKLIFEKKKEVYDLKQRIKELQKEDPNKELKLMDYYTFRDVIYAYNKKVVERVVDGDKVNLNERLGYMYIGKINKPSKLINWEESKALKQQIIDEGDTPRDKEHPSGENWLVYYDNPFYFRWTWQKRNGICKVKNHTVYGFYPTNKSSKGVPGAKSQLVEANKKNPLLHLKYVTR